MFKILIFLFYFLILLTCNSIIIYFNKLKMINTNQNKDNTGSSNNSANSGNSINSQNKPQTYKVIKLIGEGAFGRAYLVECNSDRVIY